MPNEVSARRRLRLAVALWLAACGALATARASAEPTAVESPRATVIETIPAGTKIRFSLLKPVSSQTSVSGERFAFVLAAPLAVDGRPVVAQGAVGIGTLILAGHAGSQGHEGDLTLALDSIQAADGLLTFGSERFRINGRNRKIASGLLGLVPYVGIGARFIRGSEIVLAAGEPVDETLASPASFASDAP